MIKPLIMAILNITPDSFYDGGLYLDPEKALDHAYELIAQGADIIDIGAESTRPGAIKITEEEELKRIIPALKKIRENINAKISIDTYKSKVAEECLDLGANIINDVYDKDKNMMNVIKKYKCPFVKMHCEELSSNDIANELKEYFLSYINSLSEKMEVIFDPGIGFNKTPEQNWILMNNIENLKVSGYPLLVGASRKTFRDSQGRRKKRSSVLELSKMADIIRVHTVGELK